MSNKLSFAKRLESARDELQQLQLRKTRLESRREHSMAELDKVNAKIIDLVGEEDPEEALAQLEKNIEQLAKKIDMNLTEVENGLSSYS